MSAINGVVTRSGARQLPALWRGTVLEVHSNGMVWVTIPKLAGGEPVGPMPTVVYNLTIGEQVIVGAVEGSPNDLLVVSRLSATEMTTKAYVDTLIATHAHDWSAILNKPSTFLPSPHIHNASDVETGVFHPARLPAATTTVQGALSPADKTKLDSATTTATANTLVLRTAGAAVNVGTPTANGHATPKSYVDTEVGGRAPLVHGHTYADITGTVPTAALPPLAVTEVFPVVSQAAMLALTAQRGDVAIRSDNGKSYILSADPPSVLANWVELMATGQVVSVAGKTGTVTLVKADVGLGDVNNTSDLAKPVSTATQAALDGKAAAVHTHDAADIASGVLDPTRLPAATQMVQGALSATDKTKLDNAVSTSTASRLVIRDAAGRAQFADPAAMNDAANKYYVDTHLPVYPVTYAVTTQAAGMAGAAYNTANTDGLSDSVMFTPSSAFDSIVGLTSADLAFKNTASAERRLISLKRPGLWKVSFFMDMTTAGAGMELKTVVAVDAWAGASGGNAVRHDSSSAGYAKDHGSGVRIARNSDSVYAYRVAGAPDLDLYFRFGAFCVGGSAPQIYLSGMSVWIEYMGQLV